MKRGIITFDLETIEYLERVIYSELKKEHLANFTTTSTSKLPSELTDKMRLRTNEPTQTFELSEQTIESILDLLPPPHLSTSPVEQKLRSTLQTFIQD